MQGLVSAEFADKDNTLAGKTVLITSGPTHEYLDPVRFLTNPSSGKMGYALAREAARRGATVHFVSGPVAPAVLPSDCAKIHRVETAEQMLGKVKSISEGVDLFIFAAAVSDFRVANPPSQKIKRTGNSLTLPLVENPDIAQAIGHLKNPHQVSVGFAAETQDLESNAISKMNRKKLDAIVANDVANPRIGFDRNENEVTIYLRDGSKVQVSRRPKAEVAREIFAAIVPLIPAHE
jgi:phosphopantothenoylcysteine decarboxylase/phosphopantothenate--cysteine ligase